MEHEASGMKRSARRDRDNGMDSRTRVSSDPPDRVDVLGGTVMVESHGRVPFWIRGIASLGNWAGMKRDIVIYDPSGTEFYRDGPYDNITYRRPINQLVERIERHGLDAVLRNARLEEGHLGPVRRRSRLTLWQETAPYVSRIRSWRRR